MSKKAPRGRKMRSDNVRVVPEFREQKNISKLCQTLIELARNITAKQPQTIEGKESSNDQVQNSTGTSG